VGTSQRGAAPDGLTTSAPDQPSRVARPLYADTEVSVAAGDQRHQSQGPPPGSGRQYAGDVPVVAFLRTEFPAFIAAEGAEPFGARPAALQTLETPAVCAWSLCENVLKSFRPAPAPAMLAAWTRPTGGRVARSGRGRHNRITGG
jgi:hypothetical protein